MDKVKTNLFLIIYFEEFYKKLKFLIFICVMCIKKVSESPKLIK